MNNRIGLAIVTYTINYGTFLQAFATQTAVDNLGYETEILNIRSVMADVSKARRKYFARQIFNLPELKSYRHTIEAIIARKIDPQYKAYFSEREKCFRAFNERFFKIGPVCNSWEGLSSHCRNFESIVVGSDQLWRPANIAGDFYTLNFVPLDINKVSYATSFGLNQIRKDQKEKAAAFLQRIDFLSCRETSGKRIVKELTGREAEVVCDPTLLLSRMEWNSFLPDNPVVEGKYILVYLLGNNKKHRQFVKRLAAMTSCRIVGVLHGAGYIKGDGSFVDEAPAALDPFDFINLIKNAQYICTDSFHGCVFSTIFEKNFYAFKRFSDQDRMSTNTRVIDLLDRFGLGDRLVENFNNIDVSAIDYGKVNQNVEAFRQASLRYLRNALMKNEEV